MSWIALATSIVLLGAEPAPPEFGTMLARAAQLSQGPDWRVEDLTGQPAKPTKSTHLIITSSDFTWPQGVSAETLWRLDTWPSATVGAEPDSALAANARPIPIQQALTLAQRAIETGQIAGLSTSAQLYRPDGKPNDRGLYLMAVTTLAALTKAAPEGLPPNLTRLWMSRDSVVTPPMAKAFQDIAWQAVQATPEWTAAPSAPLQVEPDPPYADLSSLGGIENPNLALNLAEVTDWSTQLPFLDMMKTARPWVAHKAGQWGAYDHDHLARLGLLDQAGWPKALPPDATGISTLVLTDLPLGTGGAAGRYVLRHKGRATLRLEGRAKIVSRDIGEVIFDYTPGEGGVLLTLSEIDPNDPLRDLRIIRQDRLPLHAQGEIFNPDWLGRLQGVKLLRFMDWMRTNNATLSALADRPKVEDYTWARHGVPPEVMIQLANTLKADAWFTLPHLAQDDLVRHYARLARDQIGQNQNVYVEYSNEVWNHIFTQSSWAEQEARARWGQDWKWVQLYALRAAEVAQIWADEFGPQKDRLIRVIGVHTAWQGLEIDILDAPLVQAEGKPAPHSQFDAMAVTGYFSGRIGGEEKADLLLGWLADSRQAAETEAQRLNLSGSDALNYIQAHRFDQAIARTSQEMRDGSLSGDALHSLDHLLTEVLPWHQKAAQSRGLQMVMYEGGTHAVAHGRLQNDPEVTAFLTALNYSDQMGALYSDLLRGWAALSNAPFNAFVDVMTPSKYGSWGGLRHLGDENPRWRALAQGEEK